MTNWLRRLKLPPPEETEGKPCDRIDPDDEQQTSLSDFETDEDRSPNAAD